MGHTDTIADEQYNLDLSVERAEAVKAYLRDDIAAWEAWFADDKPKQKRWGSIDVHHMISALPCEQSVGGFQKFSNETRGTALVVDGIAGPKTRHELIAAYMELEGTTLPASIEAVVHGCGKFFPEDETGEGVADAENRRVEVFCFHDKIVPPVPGRTATKGEPEYPLWKKQVTETIDFETSDLEDDLGTVFMELYDESGVHPLAGRSYSIAPSDAGNKTLHGTIDAEGRLRHEEVEPDDYTLSVDGCDETAAALVLNRGSQPQVRFLRTKAS